MLTIRDYIDHRFPIDSKTIPCFTSRSKIDDSLYSILLFAYDNKGSILDHTGTKRLRRRNNKKYEYAFYCYATGGYFGFTHSQYSLIDFLHYCRFNQLNNTALSVLANDIENNMRDIKLNFFIQ